jgi:tetratricopeptide (TPR) repeat protein
VTAESPEFREALELARQLRLAGRAGESEAVYRQILGVDPENVEAICGFAQIALDAAALESAVELFRRALAIHPDHAPCWTGLGTALRETEDLDGSLAAYTRAVQLDPANPSVHNNLANILKDRGQLDQAAAEYRHALAIKPDFLDARLNLGLVLLLARNLIEGFALYEARRELREPIYRLPIWKGEELRGRRILLYTRQGLGDVIHFIRYAPMVASRGGKLVVACKAELRRLLQAQPAIEQVVLNTDPLPAVDVQCALLSLPHIFSTAHDSIPATTPYLSVDAALRRRWQARLEQEPAGFKVGLNWAGNPQPRRNRKRSIGLSAMAPLSATQARFYSLQKGDASGEALNPPAGMRLVDWTADLRDLAETAALIANLDLVITCDTSVAHLAGALGVPVWVGLPFAPDWRWMLGRSDSPWYPMMRLFRQPRPGDWATVLSEMAAELSSRNANDFR